MQIRTESESIGLPFLSDVPYLGALFRTNREVQNEVELLIMVTPNFAGAMDAHEVPVGGPGFNSNSPLEKELYGNGYIEVPPGCAPQGNCPPKYCPPNEEPQILYNNASSPNGTAIGGTATNGQKRNQAPIHTAGTKNQTACQGGVSAARTVTVRRLSVDIISNAA